MADHAMTAANRIRQSATSALRIPHSTRMPYLYNTPEDQAAMLAAIGAESIDELFALIPADLRLKRPLRLAAGAVARWSSTQHMTAARREERARRHEGLLPRRRQLRPLHSRGRRRRSPAAASSTPRTRRTRPRSSQGNLQVDVRVSVAHHAAHRPRRRRTPASTTAAAPRPKRC